MRQFAVTFLEETREIATAAGKRNALYYRLSRVLWKTTGEMLKYMQVNKSNVSRYLDSFYLLPYDCDDHDDHHNQHDRDDPSSTTDNAKESASVSMHTGKLVRLNRLFSHPSGRLCSVAVDHFIGYPEGLPAGLRHIARTLRAIAAGRPDAVTMHKGIAAAAWAPYAGAIPLILQSTIARVDDTACEQIATPGDAVRLGADAFAVAAFVRGDSEAGHLRRVADAVRSAVRYEMPVICHIYPRDFHAGQPVVSYEPEDIAWAVRCAVECGADVVKVPYCGSVAAYAEIVADCPVPVVAAGGPQTKTLEAALQMMAEVVASGARGATIGRNVWSADDISATVRAFKAVIHDGKTPQQALCENGLALPAPA